MKVSRGAIPVGFYSVMSLDEGQPLYLETRHGGENEDGWPVGPEYQITWTSDKDVIPPLDSLSDGWPLGRLIDSIDRVAASSPERWVGDENRL